MKTMKCYLENEARVNVSDQNGVDQRSAEFASRGRMMHGNQIIYCCCSGVSAYAVTCFSVMLA